jgi:glucoamylase
LWNGVITEVYYPTVDHPQIRDLQYLVTDGKSFVHEEKRHLKSTCERLSAHALGYRITNVDPSGRYAIVKEIITDPHSGCILQHTQLTGDETFISKLRLYVLCAPHLQVGGSSNNGYVVEVGGRKILMAQKKEIWLALGGTGQLFSYIVWLRGPK